MIQVAEHGLSERNAKYDLGQKIFKRSSSQELMFRFERRKHYSFRKKFRVAFLQYKKVLSPS
jgi:hypothetical protein